MSRARHLSLSLVVLLAAPLGVMALACGGGKPPETPADESSGDDAAPATADSSAATDMPAAAGSSDTSSSSGSAAPADSAPAAAAAPSTPALGSTDCGKCIDKTCAKPAAACGKNSDCQAMLDAVHGCNSAAASCLENATAPSAAKPKKLAAAYSKCATKAVSSKACKASCSQ